MKWKPILWGVAIFLGLWGIIAAVIVFATKPGQTLPPVGTECNGNGTKRDGRCVCGPRYSGVECETPNTFAQAWVLIRNQQTFKFDDVNDPLDAPQIKALDDMIKFLAQPGMVGYDATIDPSLMRPGDPAARMFERAAALARAPDSINRSWLAQTVIGTFPASYFQKVCENGGSLRDGVCVCPPRFSGSNCERLTTVNERWARIVNQARTAIDQSYKGTHISASHERIELFNVAFRLLKPPMMFGDIQTVFRGANGPEDISKLLTELGVSHVTPVPAESMYVVYPGFADSIEPPDMHGFVAQSDAKGIRGNPIVYPATTKLFPEKALAQRDALIEAWCAEMCDKQPSCSYANTVSYYQSVPDLASCDMYAAGTDWSWTNTNPGEFQTLIKRKK